MWYLSDLISDLAFVFKYIDQMKIKYFDFGLLIETKVMVYQDGYKVSITPYEPIYTRPKQDKY